MKHMLTFAGAILAKACLRAYYILVIAWRLFS